MICKSHLNYILHCIQSVLDTGTHASFGNLEQEQYSPCACMPSKFIIYLFSLRNDKYLTPFLTLNLRLENGNG